MRFTSPSSLSRRLYVVSNWSPAYGEVDDRTPTDDIEAANLITSALDVPTPGGKKSAALHSPALDLDIEHVFEPAGLGEETARVGLGVAERIGQPHGAVKIGRAHV